MGMSTLVRRWLRVLVACLTMCIWLGPSRDAAASPARHWVDDREMARLTARHPAAIGFFDEAEARAAAGDAERALVALQKAASEAPESALVARRECEVLTILGRRAEAIASCLRALRNEGSGLDMRAMVAALMSGEALPTSGELAQAMRLARRARDSMPNDPYGHAAECDIAERIGDAEMLEHCLGELERVAPGHQETVRAQRAAARWLPTWRVWGGWSLVLILVLGTLVHALWRALRSSATRPAAGRGAAILLATVVALSISTEARSESAGTETQAPSGTGRMLSEWPVDDTDPESSVPSDRKKEHNPLQFGYWLMDLTYKADLATKRSDYQASIKYYKALVKAVPDRSVSYTRLCESYEAAGDWKSAVDACATALTQGGVTVNEYAHYFSVALAKKGALSGQEVDALSSVLDHLRGDPAGSQVVDDLMCQLGVRLEDVNRLEQCTTALAAKSPTDPRTISYQWALALKRGNFDEAAGLIERARATDMKPEGIDHMVRGTEAILATRRRKFYAWGFGALAIVFGLGAAIVFFVSRRRKTFGAAAT